MPRRRGISCVPTLFLLSPFKHSREERQHFRFDSCPDVVSVSSFIQLERMRDFEGAQKLIELIRADRNILESIGRPRIKRDRQPSQIPYIVGRHLERPRAPSPSYPAVEHK